LINTHAKQRKRSKSAKKLDLKVAGLIRRKGKWKRFEAFKLLMTG